MTTFDPCRECALRSVSDDPQDLAWAQAHAAECPECGARLAAQTELERAVESWRAASPEPPASLEARILGSVRAAELAPPVRFRPRSERQSRSVGVSRFATWLAAAAGLILSAGLLLRSEIFRDVVTPPSGPLLVERALRDAEAAEAAHARAIAQLELAAAPLLARVGDPALPPREAALLLSYRDRLRFLDRTVAEVGGFLAENPSHAKARTVLLAAYFEKTEVLREVLALEPSVGGRS
jgi:hypothetical protein